MNRANSSSLVPAGSMPRSIYTRWRKAGSAMMRVTLVAIFAITGRGVPVGANRPNHVGEQRRAFLADDRQCLDAAALQLRDHVGECQHRDRGCSRQQRGDDLGPAPERHPYDVSAGVLL